MIQAARQQEASMDYLGTIVGVAVAAALAAFFLKRKPAETARAKAGRMLLVVVSAGLAAALAALGVVLLHGFHDGYTSAEIDRAVEEARQWPLINVVVSDHPELDAQLRAAIEDDLRHPDRQGPKSSQRLGMEIRQRYVAPALRKADDAASLAAIGATEKLLEHLETVDAAQCRDAGVSGIQDPARLDAEGRALFKQSLSMQESAYRSGSTAATEPKALTETEVASLLKKAGYSQADFDQLIKLLALPTAEACAASVKLYGAPALLPTAEGAQVARWLLTVPQ
jgi:hypothetical protein